MAVEHNKIESDSVALQTTKKSYTDEFKATALALVDSCGGEGHVLRVAEELGIARSTLGDWWRGAHVTEAVPELRHVKRAELARMLANLAHDGLSDLSREGRLSEASVREVMGVIGLSIDKLQLLTGEATQRTTTTIERGIYTDLRYIPDVEDAKVLEQTTKWAVEPPKTEEENHES